MKYIILTLSLLVVVIAFNFCSDKPQPVIPDSMEGLENLTVYEAEKKPKSSIEFLAETTFSESDDLLIGSVVEVLVDSVGCVYVGDYSANKIHVFQPDGSYQISIGEEGSGPGEFGRISQIKIDDRLIHIFDWSQYKIEAFSLKSLELVHTTLLDFNDEASSDLSGWRVNSFYLLEDGNYLLQFNMPPRPDNLDEKNDHRLYKVSTEGKILSDIILELPVGESLVDKEIPLIMDAPYARKSRVIVSGETLYKLWTEDLAIKTFETDGRYKSAFYYLVEKSLLSRTQLLDRYENEMIQQVIHKASLPETWPAVDNFLMDDEGRFWISKIVDDREVFEWWVLEPDGALIGQFIWPRNKSIRQIKKGFAYVLETDRKSGEQEIVKYQVKFK